MKTWYRLLGAVCLLASLVLIYLSLPKKAPEKPAEVKKATVAAAEFASQNEFETDPTLPIDFDELISINEDIYAWLYIPGTEINHPVLQSVRGDNDYYLTHSVDHREDENGCLFTEYLYSDKEFEIPVTVIYGHRRRSGDMFGQLQDLYSVPGSLEKYGEILVYTPEKELRYRVIGESEFSDIHIPFHYKRFQKEEDILLFLRDVKRYHTMVRQFDDSEDVLPSDRLLVLSTCLVRDEDQRFLVIAKLTDERYWAT